MDGHVQIGFFEAEVILGNEELGLDEKRCNAHVVTSDAILQY